MPKTADAAPGRSTSIALTSDETRVVVVNRLANSVSIIQVKDKDGKDVSDKIAEIPVGEEPRCVAVHPSNRAAYVTNAISGTVSVVDLNRHTQVAELSVGTEPRGCALTADGSLLYVANLTEGTVSIIITSDPLHPISDGAVTVGGRPWAVAITDKGTGSISDDTVFVTDAFAELNPNFSDPTFDGNGEARDQGKQGVVHAFPAGNGNPSITKITLSPLADSGFDANRISPNNFCGTAAHSLIFCPDPSDLSAPINTADPQGVFPNQLTSGLIRGSRLYLPNIGSQPEPPEVFNVNVQALVYNVDVNALSEVPAEHVNLNNQIKVETAQPPPSLARTFGNDLVAIDGSAAGDRFLIVSRGGNQIFRATLDASGQLDILNAAKTGVDCRLQTGNLPSGVAIRKDGTRAYADNDVNFSVTSMDTDNCLTLQLDISSSDPPAPGSVAHMSLVGNLAFFTALGIPDNGFQGTDIRDIIPRNFRGKQSKDAWSSCGSCHNDGLSDGVTWIFGTGPRRTKPLDGMFSKQDPEDQDILNWSAIRDSNTDFNNNSRAVQGGCGFASDNFDPGNCFAKGNMTGANPAIYDHGITQGGSDALDAQTLWIFTAVRPLHQPQPADTSAGQAVFGQFCASCHGGPKWTKSQIFHRTNPGAVAQNGAPLDPGVSNTLNEFKSFTCTGAKSSITFNYLEKVGTFNPDDPLEIRDNATAAIALGADGINPPSLISINFHAPYLHNGRAETLEDVFPLHGLGPQGTTFPPTTTIANTLTAQQQADLLVFLKSIDGTTVPFSSDADAFKDALRAQGTCPVPE
ncbi:MAG: beta-propeller fold lactonase family protein [Alphaproteobacteria bacterium]|nr:beta-propeller fold lactonase family protein [Alphaproteobacteria bacterium]